MIVTALNYNKFYFEQLLVFLTSVKLNSPGDIVSIFLVDFPEDVENKLKEVFGNFKFINRQLGLDTSNKKKVAGFMVCYRSLAVKECLEKYKEPVAWFDTDIIIRKDLKHFWSDVKTNQLKILYRGPKVPKDCRFQAGVFAIGYSDVTLEYISKWNSTIQASPRWFEDQKHLYLIYKKYSKKIELIKMSKEFNDVGSKGKKDAFDDDSTVWHCKKKHFYNDKFRKEYLNYLKKVEGNFDE